ncbi:MAG: hypothetical protein ABSE62_01815 [Chthoniobacteraceae bacterium]|jgi:hypothetical protein
MSRPAVAFLALAFCIGLAAYAAPMQPASPLPTPFPETRYRQMSQKSPFAVATAVAAAPAPTPGFASQLYINGIARVGDVYYVAIKSRDGDPNKPTMLLQIGQPSPDGMEVKSVNWSDVVGKSTVDVTKDGEDATLAFDEDQIEKGATPDTDQQGIRYPGMPNGPRQIRFPIQNGYGRGFPGQPGYSRPGYPQPGYSQPGYPQPSYSQPGYPQPSYSQPGNSIRRFRSGMIQSGQ